jgi:transposase-like protein
MGRKRKVHSASFKAQVALAALKGDRTVSELSSVHGVHATMIHAWKKQLLSGAEWVFENGVTTSSVEHEELQARLYEEIGRLQTELAWLKKKAARFG